MKKVYDSRRKAIHNQEQIAFNISKRLLVELKTHDTENFTNIDQSRYFFVKIIVVLIATDLNPIKYISNDTADQ